MQTKRMTRRDKLQEPMPVVGRKTKDKFREQHQPAPIVAMTDNTYIANIMTFDKLK